MRRLTPYLGHFLPFLLFFLIILPLGCYSDTPAITKYGIYAVSYGNLIELQGIGGLYINRPEYKLKDKGGVPDIVVLKDKKTYFMVSSPFPVYFPEQKGLLFELQYYSSDIPGGYLGGGIVHTYRSKREIKCSIKGVEASQGDPREGRQGRFTYKLIPQEKLTDGEYVLDLDIELISSYYPFSMSVSSAESEREEKLEEVTAEVQLDSKTHSKLKPSEVTQRYLSAILENDIQTVYKLSFLLFDTEVVIYKDIKFNKENIGVVATILKNGSVVVERIVKNFAIIIYHTPNKPTNCEPYDTFLLYKSPLGWTIFENRDIENLPETEKLLEVLKELTSNEEEFIADSNLKAKMQRVLELYGEGKAHQESSKVEAKQRKEAKDVEQDILESTEPPVPKTLELYGEGKAHQELSKVEAKQRKEAKDIEQDILESTEPPVPKTKEPVFQREKPTQGGRWESVKKKRWVDITKTEKIWIPERVEDDKLVKGHYEEKTIPGGYWEEYDEKVWVPEKEEKPVTTERRLKDGYWYVKRYIEDPPGSGHYKEGWVPYEGPKQPPVKQSPPAKQPPKDPMMEAIDTMKKIFGVKP